MYFFTTNGRVCARINTKDKTFSKIPQDRRNAAFLAKLRVCEGSNNRIPQTKSSKCPSSFFCQLFNKYTALLYWIYKPHKRNSHLCFCWVALPWFNLFPYTKARPLQFRIVWQHSLKKKGNNILYLLAGKFLQIKYYHTSLEAVV